MISALPVAGAGAERPYSDAGVDRHRRADYGVWELAPALERGGKPPRSKIGARRRRSQLV
ncbi:MAG: hypothetical protein DMG21_10695 [Acidobacteria bacterium]|nr:MAG: hypothetical protein DMG21_10695 [Acidobacteriota bacterium]